MAPQYEALHHDVYRLRDEHLTHEASAALDDPRALAARVREVAPGVHALPLFTADYCARLLEELHRRQRFAERVGRALRRPNSMNRDGVILEEVGFEALLDDLLARVAVPLGRWGFAHVGGDALDHHHGFTVEYSPERDRDLSLHIDDAEVTLNLCLGDAFEGGALAVVGHRCLAHADTPLLAGEDAVELTRAPNAGEHVDDVLTNVLGYDAEKVGALKAAGVFGDA